MPSDTFYDFTLLKKISYSNAEFEQKLISIFVETVPESLNTLKSAWEARNFQVLATSAHKLKTTIHSMEISPLKEGIKRLEWLATQHADSAETALLFSEIHATLSQIVEEFKSRLELRRSR